MEESSSIIIGMWVQIPPEVPISKCLFIKTVMQLTLNQRYVSSTPTTGTKCSCSSSGKTPDL